MTEIPNTKELDSNLLRLTLVHPTNPSKDLHVENIVTDVGLRDEREMRVVGVSMALALRRAVLNRDKRKPTTRRPRRRPR